MKNYFHHNELRCPESGKYILATGFLDKLNFLREKFGYPMIVNSCCRSQEYNEKIGGAKNSFHIFNKEIGTDLYTQGTCAIDISTKDMNNFVRESLIFLATKYGWSIGVYNNFIHLDRRIDYTILKQTFFKQN